MRKKWKRSGVGNVTGEEELGADIIPTPWRGSHRHKQTSGVRGADTNFHNGLTWVLVKSQGAESHSGGGNGVYSS